jgi:phosphotransferase system  glucose/maltose/N-acetylglucosamine-specific IIC component
VMCLLRLLGGSAASVPLARRDWQPPPAPAPLLPMADVASFAPVVAALLDLLAAPGDDGEPKVVQSLYRHFAHLPAFLALAVTLLVARRRDGAIAAAVAALQRAMSAAADELVRAMDAPPVPHTGARPALTRFGGGVIAEMIVVGTLLERALP